MTSPSERPVLGIAPKEIIIPGLPIAKARPRFVRGHVYNGQRNEEDRFRWEVKRSWGRKPLTGALTIFLMFSFPLPPSLSRREKELRLEAGHVIKPDLDNLVKFVLDCMNKIVFQDDKQIAFLSSGKYYAKEAETYIQIREGRE